ncbi:hypothetical protein Esti_006105 [Eimeria stiedai]
MKQVSPLPIGQQQQQQQQQQRLELLPHGASPQPHLGQAVLPQQQQPLLPAHTQPLPLHQPMLPHQPHLVVPQQHPVVHAHQQQQQQPHPLASPQGLQQQQFQPLPHQHLHVQRMQPQQQQQFLHHPQLQQQFVQQAQLQLQHMPQHLQQQQQQLQLQQQHTMTSLQRQFLQQQQQPQLFVRQQPVTPQRPQTPLQPHQLPQPHLQQHQLQQLHVQQQRQQQLLQQAQLQQQESPQAAVHRVMSPMSSSSSSNLGGLRAPALTPRPSPVNRGGPPVGAPPAGAAASASPGAATAAGAALEAVHIAARPGSASTVADLVREAMEAAEAAEQEPPSYGDVREADEGFAEDDMLDFAEDIAALMEAFLNPSVAVAAQTLELTVQLALDFVDELVAKGLETRREQEENAEEASEEARPKPQLLAEDVIEALADHPRKALRCREALESYKLLEEFKCAFPDDKYLSPSPVQAQQGAPSGPAGAPPVSASTSGGGPLAPHPPTLQGFQGQHHIPRASPLHATQYDLGVAIQRPHVAGALSHPPMQHPLRTQKVEVPSDAKLRPASFQELRVAAAEAESDLRATMDSALSEADVAVYAKRTVAALLLASPWPLRLEDVRKCWQASPLHSRRRSLAALVLCRLAGISSPAQGSELPGSWNKYVALRQGARFKPHLQLLRSRREEELRGFLLFLSAQFRSSRAELPLETLKAHLRLVGRSDLLRDFDGEEAAKRFHSEFILQRLDSLEAFLSYCESLKYITIVRRSLGADADIGASVFILPTGRLLHEVQSDAFRAECREHFGVEPPDTPLQPPEAEPSDSRPSLSGAPT